MRFCCKVLVLALLSAVPTGCEPVPHQDRDGLPRPKQEEVSQGIRSQDVAVTGVTGREQANSRMVWLEQVWDAERRDHGWASEREQAIKDYLALENNVKLDLVECRTKYCKIIVNAQGRTSTTLGSVAKKAWQKSQRTDRPCGGSVESFQANLGAPLVMYGTRCIALIERSPGNWHFPDAGP